MSTPFKLKGWSPFTQKTSKPTPHDVPEVPVGRDDEVETEEFKGFTYDEETKLWINNDTGKSFTKDELLKAVKKENV